DVEDCGLQRVRPLGLDLTPREPLVAARVAVQSLANHNLADTASVLIRWHQDKGHVIRIVPKNLLGAMWLQFARGVAGEASYRRCKVCGKWLTISAEDHGFRKNREICSNTCRQRDHRAKVKLARQLRADGKTVRGIARHFDTTPETIANWLTKEK